VRGSACGYDLTSPFVDSHCGFRQFSNVVPTEYTSGKTNTRICPKNPQYFGNCQREPALTHRLTAYLRVHVCSCTDFSCTRLFHSQNTVEASLAGQSHVTKAAMAVLLLFHLLSRSKKIYELLAVIPAAYVLLTLATTPLAPSFRTRNTCGMLSRKMDSHKGRYCSMGTDAVERVLA
jgi:hypothetical protein